MKEYTKLTSKLMFIMICCLIIFGCQNSKSLSNYVAPDEYTYSVFFLVDDEDAIEENNRLMELYKTNISIISQLGVLKASTSDAKIIKKELNITDYPVYIVFDSQKEIIVESNFETFYEKFHMLVDKNY